MVTVTLDHERTNIKLFRYLTLKYAPDFAILFADPRITEITLKGVSLNSMRFFPDWLRSCYELDHKNQKISGRLTTRSLIGL